MFASVLDRLTALGGRKLLIGAYLPVLLFFGALGIGIYVQLGTVRMVRHWNSFGDLKPVAGVVFFLLTIVLAYLLQICTPWFSRTLQGANWPEWIAKGRAVARLKEREKMRVMRDEAMVRFALYKSRVGEGNQIGTDITRIRDAQKRTQGKPIDQAAENDADALLEDCEKLRSRAIDQPAERQIDRAITELDRVCNLGIPPPKAARIVDVLEDLLDRVNADATFEFSRLKSEFNSRYGLNLSAAAIPPTQLGAIFARADGYAEERYGIDGSAIWPRLEKVITEDYRNKLEDARLAYSFVVVAIWLAVAFALLWMCLPTLLGTSIETTWVWYALGFLPLLMAAFLYFGVARAAAVTYCSIYKSCFDLFRFDLLVAMRERLPDSTADEKLLWNDISKLIRYGEKPGAPRWYKHPPAGKA